MKDCHRDVIAFHDADVTLPEAERSEMRARRDANRDRLKSGLERDEEPAPALFRTQGSYAMRTMVQQAEKDYDIDDGVYFAEEKLKGPRGGSKSAGAAKEMVREALHSGLFSTPPERRKNCVRVYYDAGYHVDVPVYRQRTEKTAWQSKTWNELASSDWLCSEPDDVTAWFLRANQTQSPDQKNGGQLRRIVRLLKYFARSRASWAGRIATGFMITKLVVDNYRASARREDLALLNTMAAIRDRLNVSLMIEDPTMPGEWLTKGMDDSRARLLREKLDWALGELEDVRSESRTEVLGAWDRVFSTTFFGKRGEKLKAAAAPSSVLIVGAERGAGRSAVDKRGGGRYA